MNPAAAVVRLALRGVALAIAEGSLVFDAPDGVLAHGDLEELRLHRDELVSFLGDEREARALVMREAVRLVNGRERPSEERPTWEMPPDATGWPRWLLDQGDWVRDCLWATELTEAEVGRMGDPGDLEELPAEVWPPSCPPTDEEWNAHGEHCYREEMDAARRRCGLDLGKVTP